MWSHRVVCLAFAVLLAMGSAAPLDEFGVLREFDDSQERSGPLSDFLREVKRAPVFVYRGIGPSAKFFVDEGIRAVRRTGITDQKPGMGIKSADGSNREGIGKMACFFKICTFRTEML
ncbi:uncharacterized protein LOC100902363 [Galendromus occidentalis]|uniref:Uncharacterized protein LOC100902363 n=1 Tax=Galendromus occidentalis TaxID=34638 RepID=A0AAJ6QW01_9ACAR|nr:uncharacterized protein LOC100902363 [Galendromus occidentalis]